MIPGNKKIKAAVKTIQTVCMLVFLFSCSAFAMKTEFTPSCYISEDYTDNYDQTKHNKEDEFYTTYGLEFVLAFLDQTRAIYLTYNPLYEDYATMDENDSLQHNVSLTGDIALSRRANVNFALVYDDYDEGDEDTLRESRESSASLGADYQLTKYTNVGFSHEYTDTFDRTQRTGEWKEYETNTTTAGFSHIFGKENSLGMNYSYSSDDYEEEDADENIEHMVSGNLAYWFTPLIGFDTNASFEKTDYDLSGDADTWYGDVRLIKRLTRHFQVYAKYAHTDTREEERDHTVYNPSAGFDWDISEDSGISLGLGYLLQEWEGEDDDHGLFFEADAFKTFNFSRRGAFTISGLSGYDATDDEAESLGFNIYYEAGCLLTYKLTRKMTTNLRLSWTRDEYEDPEVDRVDNTVDFGAGLSWTPLRWMTLNFDYEFTDFDTDSHENEEYRENRGTVTVRFHPVKPVTIKGEGEFSRQDYDQMIFPD